MRWFLRLLPMLLLAPTVLGACAEEEIVSPSLRPAWVANQEFHLETRYREISLRTERGNAATDPAADNLDETVDLGDLWSDPVYWRYQVLYTGLRPSEGDDFYEHSVMGGTDSALTVVKGSLNTALNLEGPVSDMDPKLYLIIREDRLRLAGLVSFYTVNGERISQALTLDDEAMNRSYNLLSQSKLSVVPHAIPPFPILPENGDRVLEDGQLVSFANANDDSVDVVYEDLMDGTVLADTWEEGQPWSSRSVTANSDSRLMSSDEVSAMGGSSGAFDNHDDEDFEFVERLKSAVNLSSSLSVDTLLGASSHSAREGYRPWAGNWWPQAEGKLIFGHLSGDNDTPSEINKSIFEENAKAVQNIGEELRNLRKAGNGESDEYREKVDEYKGHQQGLVDDLVGFYTAVFQGIDGGSILLENSGSTADPNWLLSANAGWGSADSGSTLGFPAFSYEINKMSPLDKFALLQQIEGTTQASNPWFASAWEMLNHWSPAGSSWWGHCNGWAAAAILTHEPQASHTVDFGNAGQKMDLGVADQKGLLSESYYSQLSHFYGSRYNGDDGDDISDLSPKAVLQLLTHYIKDQEVTLVFDTSANEEVWNFPAWSYTLTLNETSTGGSGGASGRININTAGVDELKTLWGMTTVRAQRVVEYREANGPFQGVEGLKNVPGIGAGMYNRIVEQITVTMSTDLRTFTGDLSVRFATDGVGTSHVDSDQDSPQGFAKDWDFTLEASPAGEIISGTWNDNDNGHPDFAWVPYVNTVQSGQSENNYLEWTDLKRYLTNSEGEGPVRE